MKRAEGLNEVFARPDFQALFELAEPPEGEEAPVTSGFGASAWYWGYYCNNPRFDPDVSPTVLDYELSERGRWLWHPSDLLFPIGCVVLGMRANRYFYLVQMIRAAINP